MSLYNIYEEILSVEERWNSTKIHTIEHGFPDVLDAECSRRFIMMSLWGDGNLRPLFKELYKYGDMIPKERFTHTVSLYLLGIYVAETIGFDRFCLSSWDKSGRRNFLHHWMAVCLFHDIGYAFEEQSSSFELDTYKGIDDLIAKDIKYDLTKKDHSGLIMKYYEYRRTYCRKIDHGIAGAIILFDALMKRDEEMQEYVDSGGDVASEKPLYGKKYRDDIMSYALDIARHNMWFANNKSIDVYKECDLVDLIPKEDGSHRVSFFRTPMLFLLCLLDTVEPIKVCTAKDGMSSEAALKNCNLKVVKRGNQVRMQFENEIMCKKAKSCEDWLDIRVSSDSKIEFSLERLPSPTGCIP